MEKVIHNRKERPILAALFIFSSDKPKAALPDVVIAGDSRFDKIIENKKVGTTNVRASN